MTAPYIVDNASAGGVVPPPVLIWTPYIPPIVPQPRPNTEAPAVPYTEPHPIEYVPPAPVAVPGASGPPPVDACTRCGHLDNGGAPLSVAKESTTSAPAPEVSPVVWVLALVALALVFRG